MKSNLFMAIVVIVVIGGFAWWWGSQSPAEMPMGMNNNEQSATQPSNAQAPTMADEVNAIDLGSTDGDLNGGVDADINQL